MKVVYIGDIYSSTGYAVAAINTILSLDAAGVDVVARNIKLCGQNIPPPARIQELEKKSVDGATHVIQHYLPNLLTYRSGFKNIGYFHCETDQFKASNWQHYLNLMDEVWVCSPENIEAAKKSGVTVPIKLVPLGHDPEVYKKKYPPLEIGIGNRFAFYHIGDYSERKGSERLIRAYFEEFSRRDDVVLVLKTFREGLSPEDSHKFISGEIQKIKKKMRLCNVDVYPPIIIIPGYIPTEQVYGLHKQCNCFISLEAGAAFNLPSYEAMAFGKKTILNGYGGQTQFAPHNPPNNYLLPYQLESVYGMDHVAYQSVYNSTEKWGVPNMDAARKAMREVYNNWKNKTETPVDNTEFSNTWNLQACGNKIKKVLEDE